MAELAALQRRSFRYAIHTAIPQGVWTDVSLVPGQQSYWTMEVRSTDEKSAINIGQEDSRYALQWLYWQKPWEAKCVCIGVGEGGLEVGISLAGG